MGDDKRAHQRQTATYPVHVGLEGGGEFEGVVENIGTLGALIATNEIEIPLDSGQRVSLRILLEGDQGIAVSGEIVRVEQELAAGEIRRALAVRFDEPLDL